MTLRTAKFIIFNGAKFWEQTKIIISQQETFFSTLMDHFVPLLHHCTYCAPLLSVFEGTLCQSHSTVVGRLPSARIQYWRTCSSHEPSWIWWPTCSQLGSDQENWLARAKEAPSAFIPFPWWPRCVYRSILFLEKPSLHPDLSASWNICAMGTMYFLSTKCSIINSDAPQKSLLGSYLSRETVRNHHWSTSMLSFLKYSFIGAYIVPIEEVSM